MLVCALFGGPWHMLYFGDVKPLRLLLPVIPFGCHSFFSVGHSCRMACFAAVIRLAVAVGLGSSSLPDASTAVANVAPSLTEVVM